MDDITLYDLNYIHDATSIYLEYARTVRDIQLRYISNQWTVDGCSVIQDLTDMRNNIVTIRKGMTTESCKFVGYEKIQTKINEIMRVLEILRRASNIYEMSMHPRVFGVARDLKDLIDEVRKHYSKLFDEMDIGESKDEIRESIYDFELREYQRKEKDEETDEFMSSFGSVYEDLNW
jgi:hypothetical protein